MAKPHCIACIIVVLACNSLFALEPEDLRYITEDYPPSNYVENGKLKGLAVEVLHALWAKMNVPEQKILVLPWARGFAMTVEEPGCVLFATTRSPEREALFKWVGPIYQGYWSFYSTAGKPISVNSLDEAKQYRVGVMRADFSESDLLAKGFPENRLYRMDTVQQLVRTLNLGRVDLLYLYSDTLQVFAPMLNVKESDFHQSFKVSENRLYYAFSKSTDDALITRFQNALDSMDDRRREIVLRYNCTP